MTRFSPDGLRPGFVLFRATQRITSDKPEKTSCSGNIFFSIRTIKAQHGIMCTRGSGRRERIDAPEKQTCLSYRDGNGNSLKRTDGRIVLQPDVPALVATLESMDSVAGRNAHAFCEGAHDRRHSRFADNPPIELPIAPMTVESCAGSPLTGVAEIGNLAEIALKFLRVSAEVLSPMIERIAADTCCCDAASDIAILLKDLHETACTPERACARQARDTAPMMATLFVT